MKRTDAKDSGPSAAGRAWSLVLAFLFASAGFPLGAATSRADQYEASVVFESISVTSTGITLLGTVTNTGRDPLYGTEVVFWRDPSTISTSDQLDHVLSLDADQDFGDRIHQGGSSQTIYSGEESFDPGESAQFTVVASWQDLDIHTDGVYLVGVHIRASDQPFGSLVTIGRGRTLATKADETLRHAATVVMLTSAPSLLYDNVFSDDHLAAELGSRLSTLVALASQPGVSWAVDPGLVHAVSVMAQGYQVVNGEDLVEGTASARAQAWLDDFHALGGGFRLPWYNPDLALGQSTGYTPMLDDIEYAEGVHSTLGHLPLLIKAANGRANDEFLSWISPLRPQVVLAHTGVNSRLSNGEVVLNTLEEAYPPGPGPDLATTDVQRFQRSLADNALSKEPIVRVIATLDDARLAGLALPGWISRVGIMGISTPLQWSEDTSTDPAEGPLTPGILRDINDLKHTIATYGSLIGDEEEACVVACASVIAGLSQSWAHDDQARSYVRALEAQVVELMSAVTITVTPEVTLSSRTASFPVTVTNKMEVPVHIRLVTTTHPVGTSRATVTIPAVEATVQPGDKVTLALQPQVFREGEVEAIIALTTQEGFPTQAQASVLVHARNSAWMGWAVVASAALLFVVGTFLRVKSAKGKGAKDEGDQPPL